MDEQTNNQETTEEVNNETNETTTESVDQQGQTETKETETTDVKTETPNIPESYDKYSEVEIPKDVQINPDHLEGFKKLSFENKVSDEVYAKILDFHYKAMQSENKRAQERQDKMMDDLKKEWKGDFDSNIDLARKVLANEALGLKELLMQPDVKNNENFILANNPVFVKALVQIGKMIDSDKLADAGGLPTSKGPARTEDGRPMIKYKDMQ